MAEQELDHSDGNIMLAAKGGSIVFIGAVFGYGMQFIMGIILSRLLGAEQYGQYKVALVAGEMAAGFALVGMDYAVIRYVAMFNSRRDPKSLWGILQLSIGVVTGTSLLIGVGMFFLAAPLAIRVFHDQNLVPLLRLASIIVPFSALMNILGSATMGFSNMRDSVISRQIIQPIIRLILLGLLAAYGLTAREAMIPYIVGLLLACLMLVYYLNQLFSLKRSLFDANINVKETMVFAFPAYLSTLVGTLGSSLQTMLLGSLSAMATAGIFSVAYQVGTASTLFNQSIGTASTPIVSSLHELGNRQRLAVFYQTTAKWMYTFNLPMFVILFLFSHPILEIFGAEFQAGSYTLTILCLANLIIAAAGISDGLLAMTGYTRLKLMNSILQAVFTVVFCFLLIPRWGAEGVAVSVFICSVITHVLLVSEIYTLFRMLPYDNSFIKPTLAGLISFITGFVLRAWLHTDTHLILAITNSLIILLVYGSVILLLGVPKEDEQIIRYLLQRISARLPGKKANKSLKEKVNANVKTEIPVPLHQFNNNGSHIQHSYKPKDEFSSVIKALFQKREFRMMKAQNQTKKQSTLRIFHSKFSRKFQYFFQYGIRCLGDPVKYLRLIGASIGNNCAILTSPHNFGSEPWLIDIADQVTVCQGVLFITHDGITRLFRDTLPESSKFGNRFGAIKIKENCFIGSNAILLPGIEIGPNSAVGAGSVVTKSVAPNTIVAGNPAHHIKTLNEYQCEYLQKMIPIQATDRDSLRKELTQAFWEKNR